MPKKLKRIEVGDHRMVAGPFTLTPIGLEIKGSPTIAQYEWLANALGRLERLNQWAQGDMANGVEKVRGAHKDTVKELCEASDLNPKTVRNYAWVCGCVKTSRRRDVLSWGHHEAVAALSAKDQTRWLNKAVTNGGWSVAEFRKEIKNWLREKAIDDVGDLGDSVEVESGDFRERMETLEDGSVDLIFTDPPYDEESIDLYGDLAEIAARKLCDGGSLLAYVGHYAIGDVIRGVDPHLRFWWTIAMKHSGPSSRLPGKFVFVEWKPILWFVNGGRYNKEYVADLFESTCPDKDHHDWEQDVSEAEYYIEKLSDPGGLIVDPFLGGATTGVAAINLSRRFWGCEIDKKTKRIAEDRLSKCLRE